MPSIPSAFLCCSTLPYFPSCLRGSAAGSGRRCPAKLSWRPSLADALTGTAPDVRGSPGTHAIALVADARSICLCHGRVPRRERRREGRDDQMARS